MGVIVVRKLTGLVVLAWVGIVATSGMLMPERMPASAKTRALEEKYDAQENSQGAIEWRGLAMGHKAEALTAKTEAEGMFALWGGQGGFEKQEWYQDHMDAGNAHMGMGNTKVQEGDNFYANATAQYNLGLSSELANPPQWQDALSNYGNAVVDFAAASLRFAQSIDQYNLARSRFNQAAAVYP